jgi:hypothetical protein
MPIFLEGISLAFFRGIGPEVQYLGPFKDFNFFVGANNAGKSRCVSLKAYHLVENMRAAFPWRLSDAGHCSLGTILHGRHPKPSTEGDIDHGWQLS